MSNICIYKMIIKGNKEHCYKLLNCLPSGTKEIIKEDDKSLLVQGFCKGTIDILSTKLNTLKPLSNKEIEKIEEGYYIDYSLQEKSLLLSVEILCNYRIIEEDNYNTFLHFKNGNIIESKLPKDLYLNSHLY